MLLKLAVDLKNMIDKEGKLFNLDKGIILPTFMFEVSESFDQMKKEEQRVLTQADKLRSQLPSSQKALNEPKKKDEVKCLCVHGYCRQGESHCSKCYEGWTGTMCDERVQTKKTAPVRE